MSARIRMSMDFTRSILASFFPESPGWFPVRLMGVINCSPESFYANSYIPTDFVHKTAVAMIEQGADLIDIGARSTAPNTQAISGTAEAERIAVSYTHL